ncbi:DUF6879 family protein [Saccharothrix coeruleofusca]|uniref:DUF6879 domain-containing protein n=1 Tax=Saccharothrix coeruleofusca TaxID=33919 RepID=A0A918EEZ0_9PSEU|nr:DUF6879 family protein [Saccharothrix coeruleofusca]MBP2338998.1 hypothetical protein [Saccharothrix coeruleofusca]GGP69414.1 hypothetical protein GCM10010185_47770 [Saccharothrix coeruleofusca]
MGEAAGVIGERLSLDEYSDDFDRYFWAVGAADCWKIERTQVFVEEDDPSYDAFAAGDWERALELIERRRDEQREHQRRVAEHGVTLRRVRVVEEPLAGYVLWELHSLRQRAELGERIRVVDATSLARAGRPVVDVVGIDERVAYQVLYTPEGAAVGAVAARDHEQVAAWRGVFERLYADGEPVADYFDRRVAGERP